MMKLIVYTRDYLSVTINSLQWVPRGKVYEEGYCGAPFPPFDPVSFLSLINFSFILFFYRLSFGNVNNELFVLSTSL